MKDDVIAAYPEAYALGLEAVGLLDRIASASERIASRVSGHPAVSGLSEPSELSELSVTVGVVGEAEASVASDISAERLAAVREEVLADTARLIAGPYKRIG